MTTTTRHILLNGQIIKEDIFETTILQHIQEFYNSLDMDGWLAHLDKFRTKFAGNNKAASTRMLQYQQIFHNDIQENDAQGILGMMPKLLDSYEYCCDNEAFNDMHQHWVILDIMTGGLLSKLDLTVLRVDMRDTKK